MIKGISYLSFENGLEGGHPIDSALKQTKSHGFDALELAISTQGVLTTSTTQNECHEIRQQIDDSGLFVDSLASGMSWAINPTSDDESMRKQSINLHKDAL